MPTNILQLALSFSKGGRRRAITTLVEQLERMGVRPDLCCLDALGCDVNELCGLASEWEVLGRRSLVDRKALGRLRRFCRRRRIDVIHAHDAASQFTAALVKLSLPRLRLVMTFHRSLSFESATLRDRMRNAFAIAQSGAIVTGSRERRRHFIEQNLVSSRKVVRIPFGIDTERFRPNAEDRERLRRELGAGHNDLVLGASGHFGKEKGIDIVLKGFAALKSRRPEQPLLLVVLGEGTPQQQRELEAVAAQVPGGRVHFLGFRPDVERWFRTFDVFVHAPRREAFGLVLAEAMATALPVVATHVGGIPDLVREGSTGLLVSPDSPAALADALEQVVSDRAARDVMARNARRVAVKEFAAEVYARRYLELYRDLMARRAPRGVDEEPKQSDAAFSRTLSRQNHESERPRAFSPARRSAWTPRGVS